MFVSYFAIYLLFVITIRDEVPNKLTTCLCDELPKNETGLFFGAFGFIFDDQKRLLLTNLKKRGWDIPGFLFP